MLKNLILDLDGTLLFGEQRPGALVIKGRRRDSYLAKETLINLSCLQNTYNIYFATGRSKKSVACITDMLSNEGIRTDGILAENGGIWVDREGDVHYLVSKAWMKVTKRISSIMGSTAQEEFVTCLALLSPQPAETLQALSLYSQANLKFHLFKDGNKLFILESNVQKKNGLIYGLGKAQLDISAGIGNDLNDVDWLKHVGLPACLDCSKEEVKMVVRGKGGPVSQKEGHDGINELLHLLDTDRHLYFPRA